MRKTNVSVVAKTSKFSNFTRLMALFTASLFLVSTNSAYAAQPDGMSGREARAAFSAAHPGLSKQDLNQLRHETRRQNQELRIQQSVREIRSPNLSSIQIQSDNSAKNISSHRAARQAIHNARLQEKFVTQANGGSLIKLDNGANLDLTSSVRNVTIGDKLLSDGAFVTIEVGGEKKNVYAGSQVTVAEYVAVKQVLNGGKQSVQVGANGVANGGTVDLNAIAAKRNTMTASGLTVAQGVTAVGDLARNSSFKLDGDLNNYGSVVAVATSKGRHAGDITAENITNNTGAVISSDVGHNYGNKASAIDLTLNANNDFNNSGTITSSGDLNINAGHAINNSGSASAKDNLSLNSSSINNTGNVSSAHGNITVDSAAGTVLNVNNAGGTFNAANGAINVRAAGNVDGLDTNFNGGDLLSKTVNLQTGVGMTELHVNNLTGTVNGAGTGAHVSADTDVLNLGEVCFNGDPTFKNSGGDINFTGNLTVNQALAVIASGNITATAGSNVTVTARNGNVGQLITFAAGYEVTAGDLTTTSLPADNPGQAATIPITASSGGTATGGNIDFSNAASFNINTNATGLLNAGGNVNLFALQVGGNGGNILMPAVSTINAQSTGGTNGNVTVVGAGNINLGNITTTNGVLGGGGTVLVRNANPTGSTTFATNGTISAGGFSTAGPATSGSITFNNGATVAARNAVTIDSFGVVNSAGGGLTVNSDNSTVTFSNGINTNAGTFSSTNNGLTLGGNVTTGNFNIDANGNNITAPVAGITITTDAYNVNNVDDFTVGTGTIVIQNRTAGTTVGVAGGAGTLNISAGELADLVAGNVTIGSATAGTITAGGAINISGTPGTTNGAYNLTFLTNNAFSGGANNVTLGNQSLTITALNNVTYGNITGGTNAAAIDISSTAGSVTLGNLTNQTGTIDVDALNSVSIGTITTTTGVVDIDATNGAATIAAISKTGGNNVTVDAGTNVTVTGATSATTGDVTFTSLTGFVQTGSVTTTTGNINLDSSTGTTVNAGALQTSGGNINVDAGTSATVASVNSGAGNVDIDTGTDITVTGATNATTGSVTYTSGTGFIQTGSITTTSGNITLDSTTGTSVNTGALQTNGGNVDVDSSTSTTIASINAITGGTIDIDAGTNATITGAVTGTATSLAVNNTNGFIQTGDITTSGLVDLGGIGTTSVTVGNVNSGAGNINLNGSGAITATSLTTTGSAIADGDSITVTGATSADLGADFTSGTGAISTGAITTTTGAIVLDSTTGTSVTTGNLTTAGGNVDVDANTTILINGIAMNAGGTVDLDANGSITVTNGISGTSTDVAITSITDLISTGNIAANGNVTLNAATSVTTGTLFAGSGNVDIDTLTGSVSTGSITNTGTIDVDSGDDTTIAGINNAVGQIDITSASDTTITAAINGGAGNLTITSTTGDTTTDDISVTSGNVTLNSPAGSTTTGDIALTTGNLSITSLNNNTTGNLSSTNGNLTLTATNGNNSVGSVTITGNGLFTATSGGDTTVTGPVNTNNNVVIAASGDINLGTTTTTADIFLYSGANINTTGTLTADPIVMTAVNDINLGGSLVANDGITVVAGHDVTNTLGGISINASGATNGGNVVVVAGADYVVNVLTSVTINGASATGGSILLNNGAGISSINTSGAAGTGGDLTLAAYSNAFAGGQVLTPLTTAITTTGSGANASGDVVVMAGTLLGTAVQLGNITTNTATDGVGGNVTIRAAQPNGGPVISNNASYTGTFIAGTPLAADIRTGNITARGGNIDLESDQNIGVGNINVSGQAVGNGGTVFIAADGTDRFDIGSVSGSNFAASIQTNGGTTSGNGGAIDVVNLGTTGIRTNPLSITVTNGDGGAINLNADQGNIQLNAGTYAVNGAGTDRNGGTITLSSNSITVSGGSAALQALATGTGAGGAIDITTSGSSALTLGTGTGQFTVATSGVDDAVNIANGGNLTVSATGGFTSDHINLAGNNIAFNGAVTANDDLTMNASGAIAVAATVTGSNTLVANAVGNITGGTLVSPTMTLFSFNGNIGASAASRLNVDATNLVANAPNGSVFINDINTLNIGPGGSGAAFTFDVQSQGALTNSGTITADQVVLRSVTSSVTLGALVTGATSVTLRSSASIVDGATVFVNSNTVNLISDNGDIGASGNPINIDAVNLSANAANGDVFIADPNSINISGASSAGGTFNVIANNNLTSTATINAADVSLTAANGSLFLGANVTGSSSISLVQAQTFTNANFTNLFAPQINIASTLGDIGSGTNYVVLDANSLALNAPSGSVFVQDPNSVSLGGGTSGAAAVFSVISGDNMIVLSNVTAPIIGLTAATDLIVSANLTGSANVALQGGNNITQTTGVIATPNLSLTGSNSIQVFTTNGGGFGQVITVAGTANATITTQETGGVTLGSSTASSLLLDASSSDVDTNGNTTVTNLLDITVDGQFTNTNSVSAGTINIQSATNPLTFAGGTGGNLTATTSGGVNISAASGDLTFTGIQNIFGPATFSVTPFNAITISAGADIEGNSSVTLNTCNLNLIGTLVGNPIIFNCPLGGGTIANSTGDVNLTSDIVFNGLNFAIIASGNINAAGITTIDLSSTGNGGELTMIAGFDFTPNTGGQVQNNFLYTIGTNSTSGGSINLGSVAINTSSTTTGDGGNVLAVASAGSTNDGHITLGSIDTSANTGNGGALLALGAGNITIASIDTTGSITDGTVGLAVSQPQKIGNVFIGNGDRFGGGGFAPTVFGTGSVSIGNTFAGDINISAGSVTTTGSLVSGSGDIAIATNTLNNTFLLSAANIDVTSFPGFSLTIDGSAAAGGTLTATTGTVDLGVGTTGDVIFVGEQTFNGTTNINPSNGNSVVVSNGAVVLGNDIVNLNTCSLILQGNGSINGDPLNFNCPNGAGTIANSSGNVDLTGVNLVFVGQSLAILASGNILAGTSTLINLSNPTGAGGSLLAVAGFDFTPSTGGQINTPNPVVYTLGSPSNSGGNINFTGLNILTNGGAGDGGDVTLVAKSGNTAAGTVVVGNIDTSSVGGFGGDILIIAEGGATFGSLTTTGTNGDGLQTVAAATPTIVNGPILVLNGEQGGPGSFAFGPATGAGTIANSNGNVDLSTLTLNFIGLDLAIIASGDVIAGSNTSINLSNGSGSAGDLLVVAGFDFTPATVGQVNFNSGTTYTFSGPSTSGGNIDLTGLNITANGGAGNGGKVTLVAAAGNTSDGTVVVNNITATGTQNGGNVLVIAEGGFVIGNINNTGTVANGTTTLAAAAPTITGGPITVQNGTQGGTGQFTFTTPTGSGTIANSLGDVNLATDITFVGQNLAILAANDINTTGLANINLSNGAGSGGSLTMIAGFDFTPGTGGQVIDSTNTFTIGLGNTLGGNISLAGVTINLNGTTNGGNLIAVANGGTGSQGNVNLGPVSATGGNINGSVNVIASNDITTGLIDTAGAGTGGDVSLTSATPVLTGVTVFNGSVLTGTFAAGTTGSGNITTGNIGAGGSVTLTTARSAGLSVSVISATDDITINNAGGNVTEIGLQAFNGDITVNSNGLTASGSIDAGNDFIVDAGGGTVAINNTVDAGGSVNIDGTSSFTNAAGGVITANTDVLIDVDGSLTTNGNITATTGVISLNVNDNAGVADTLTVNSNLTAGNQIDIINNGTDKKIDILTLGTNAIIQTTSKLPGTGDINIRMGAAAQDPISNKLPKGKFTVVETGGTLNLFGRKPRGEKPVNTLTATGADINISLQKKGMSNKQLVFNGNVQVTADPPVAAGTPTYVNGHLLGGNTNGTVDVANAVLTTTSAPVANNVSDTNSVAMTINGINRINNADSTNINLMSVNSQNSATINLTGSTNDQRTNTILYGGVNSATCEDNSYVVGTEGPTSAVEASICSDTEFGITSVRTPHSNKVVLRKGNVLFVPFVDTVVETPHGKVSIQAKSVAMVSLNDDKLAVYDLDDSHKGAVAIEAHGQKLTLAPGNHVTIADEKAGEFAQVNAIEAIPHRHVASRTIKPGVKVHTSEFSITSAIQSIKPLRSVVGSQNAAAKKVADRLIKTNAIVLQLGGMSDYQHYFKPAITAMAK